MSLERGTRHHIQVNSPRMLDGMTVVHELFRNLEGQISNVEQQSEGGVQAIYFDAPPDINLDFLRPHILPHAPVSAGDGQADT